MTLPAIDSTAGWGADAWTDEKPIEDPTTELPAAVMRQVAADVAMSTHTSTRAFVKFTCATYSGTGTDSMTVTDHDAQWGSTESVKPTVGQTSAGVYVITWPATVTDELSVSHATNIRFPLKPTVIGSGDVDANIASTTSNTITIHAHSAGTLDSLNGLSISVGWS